MEQEPVVRCALRTPSGSAMWRPIRRSTSTVTTRAEIVDPGEPAIMKIAEQAVNVEGISSIAPQDLKAAADLRSRRCLVSPFVPDRDRTACINHGAEIVIDCGDGRDQCGDNRWRWYSTDHPGRTGRRAATASTVVADIARCCARFAHCAVRPSGRACVTSRRHR